MPLQFKNSSMQYGIGARVLHWTSVALLVTLIVTASDFEDLEASAEKVELIRQHASWGLLFLLVMCMRVYWRVSNENAVVASPQFYIDNEARFPTNVIRDGAGDIATVMSPTMIELTAPTMTRESVSRP